MQLATWLAQSTPQFPEQVTTNSLVQNVVYASGTVGAIMILAGLLMVDVGGVRRVNVFAQNVDQASMGANLNNQQIFIFFLACFAGIVNVLIHLSVTERMKPAAYYVISAVAAVVSSVLSWMTWGSTGPLTNAGFHDFFGIAFVYMFPAGMAR